MVNVKEKRIVTTSDIQAIFGVQFSTVWVWRRKGMPFFHVPPKTKLPPVRFDLDKVLEWVKENTRTEPIKNVLRKYEVE